jgi:two-component system chemotaxis response regulator CheB
MARSLGSSALGVLLTGMGEDGAEGLREIRENGGYTIAEDESTAVVY